MDVKYLIILLVLYYVVCLIISYYYYIVGYLGIEYVFFMIRERFWIVKVRVVVRKFFNDCFSCRKR